MTQSLSSAQNPRSLVSKIVIAVPVALLVAFCLTTALRAAMIVAKILTSDRAYYGPSRADDVTWPVMHLCIVGILGVILFRRKTAASAFRLGGIVALASLALGAFIIPVFCKLVRDPGGQGWRGLTNSIDEDQWAFSLLVGAACMILSFVIPKLGRLKGSVSIALPVNVGPTKQCPFCAETVKADAIVCKHCSRDISVASAAASR